MQTTLLENLFSNTQEKGAPSIVSDRKPQPGITRQDHHKQRTTKMTCYSKMTQEMRHKIVTNNGFLPKCITPFRIFSLPSQNLPYSAPEAALHLITLIFYRHTHPPYFATTTFIPVGPISRYSRTNESWSADGSTQSQTWGVFS